MIEFNREKCKSFICSECFICDVIQLTVYSLVVFTVGISIGALV